MTGRASGGRTALAVVGAAIDHLHANYAEAAQKTGIEEFDTVRALFPEGTRLYANAGFREKTHVQIAVRNLEQILGVFRVPRHHLDLYGLPDFYP